ncbi:MAG: hypothetical protein IPK22_12520 [Verrucomicrobiaceae bacterium]|nr:hypothetical protein [Verrucomicrobiaceae bacterium]
MPTLDFDPKTPTFVPLRIEIVQTTIQIIIFTSRIVVKTLTFVVEGQVWVKNALFEPVNGFREQFPRINDLLGAQSLSLSILVTETLQVATGFRHEFAPHLAQPFHSVFVMNRWA